MYIDTYSLSGGTSLITMYIPPNGKMSIFARKLNNEYGLTSNIKSKTVQKDIKTALKSALQQLNLYKDPRAPPNGFLLCSGIISGTCHNDDQQTSKRAILLEPEAVLQKAEYKCGKYFYLEPILSTYKKKIT